MVRAEAQCVDRSKPEAKRAVARVIHVIATMTYIDPILVSIAAFNDSVSQFDWQPVGVGRGGHERLNQRHGASCRDQRGTLVRPIGHDHFPLRLNDLKLHWDQLECHTNGLENATRFRVIPHRLGNLRFFQGGSLLFSRRHLRKPWG